LRRCIYRRLDVIAWRWQIWMAGREWTTRRFLSCWINIYGPKNFGPVNSYACEDALVLWRACVWCKYIAEMKVTKWKPVHRELGLKASVDHHWITVHHYSNWNYLVVSNENKERAWQLNSLFVCSCSFPSSICSVYQLAWVLVLPILGLPKMLPDWHNLLQCWKLLNYWISAVLFFCKHITFGFENTYPFSVPEEQWYSALNEQWYIPNF